MQTYPLYWFAEQQTGQVRPKRIGLVSLKFSAKINELTRDF